MDASVTAKGRRPWYPAARGLAKRARAPEPRSRLPPPTDSLRVERSPYPAPPMLIIVPVEDKPSRQRLPVICILLVITNLALFGYFDARDQVLYEEAVEIYYDQELNEREWPLYLEYLREADPGGWAELRELPEDEQEEVGVDWLIHDRYFEAWLYEQPDMDAEWQTARQRFELKRNEFSWIRFGSTPGDLQFANLFTSVFMHGSWGHVIGNMIFLVLFGVALEARLGHIRLLALYIASGVAADLVSALASAGSMTPSVGASGAISGLMGMYVGVYGVRPREFLVLLGPLVSSIRMPALIAFALWLSEEVLRALISGSDVDYWAHAGGLAAGLALMRRFRRPGDADDAPSPSPQAVPAHLRRLAEGGHFERVVTACEARLARQAGNAGFWHFYLENAARVGPAALLRAAHLLLAPLSGPAPDYATAARAYRHLVEVGAPLHELAPADRITLCRLLLQMGLARDATGILLPLLDTAPQEPGLAEVALDVSAHTEDPALAAILRAKGYGQAETPDQDGSS